MSRAMLLGVVLGAVLTLNPAPLFAKEAPAKSTATLKVEDIPAKLSDKDLDGSTPEFLAKYFILVAFPQKMQLADGKMTATEGKVLVMQKEAKMIVAFYKPEGGAYVLVGRPTVLSTVVPPRVDVHPAKGLPCIVVRRENSHDAWRLYMQKGQVISEQFTDGVKSGTEAEK